MGAIVRWSDTIGYGRRAVAFANLTLYTCGFTTRVTRRNGVTVVTEGFGNLFCCRVKATSVQESYRACRGTQDESSFPRQSLA